MTTLAGVVLRAGGALRFVPARVALRIAPAPHVTEVPGAPAALLGVALHDGAVVPVLTVGPARGEMLVCVCDGEQVGVVGAEVVRTGQFPVAAGDAAAVDLDGVAVPPLDLDALVAQVRTAGRPTLLGST